jgi:hypothetical protein
MILFARNVWERKSQKRGLHPRYPAEGGITRLTAPVGRWSLYKGYGLSLNNPLDKKPAHWFILFSA